MSKFLMILGVMAFLFTACSEDPEPPVAAFSYEPSEVFQYDEVSFSNTTTEADSYAWDFGDGESSAEMNPTHMFTSAGTFTVKLTATNADGDKEAEQSITVAAPVNEYLFGDTTYTIDAELFWYQSGMGGDPYIRLLTTVSGQDNPDLLKLYPNQGINELPGTYSWEAEGDAGTYDIGYTANYAGMSFDWVAIGVDGSSELSITELVSGVYRVECEAAMDIGTYDFQQGGLFVKSGSASLILSYVGPITPLEAK